MFKGKLTPETAPLEFTPTPLGFEAGGAGYDVLNQGKCVGRLDPVGTGWRLLWGSATWDAKSLEAGRVMARACYATWLRDPRPMPILRRRSPTAAPVRLALSAPLPESDAAWGSALDLRYVESRPALSTWSKMRSWVLGGSGPTMATWNRVTSGYLGK